MSSEIPVNGPQPFSQSRRGSRFKLIAVIVVVIVVVAAVIIVLYPHFSSSPKPLQSQPTLTFLPASTLASIYGTTITAANDSSNLTSIITPQSFFNLSSQGFVKGEAWVYEGQNATFNFIVATVIIEMNSTTLATSVFATLEHAWFANSTVAPTENFQGFQYVLWKGNITHNIPYDAYIAHDGKYVLLMEFDGSAVAHEGTVFQDQVSKMSPLYA